MVINQQKRILHYLESADGFMDLDLPKLALEELAAIGNPGEFLVPVMWMTGEALKADGRFDEAIAPLRRVVETAEEQWRAEAAKSLCECLEKSGRGSIAGLPTQRIDLGTRRFALMLAPNQRLTIKFS